MTVNDERYYEIASTMKKPIKLPKIARISLHTQKQYKMTVGKWKPCENFVKTL
jgi:hypothetical protein